MTDEVLKELWDAKDSIAKEHGYSIDGLAEYYLEKQASRHGRFHNEKVTKRPNKAFERDAG